MALTPELKERLSNPSERDSAMFDFMIGLIKESTCNTEEMLRAAVKLPVLNDLGEGQIRESLLRVHIANQILPQVRVEIANWISAILITDKEVVGFDEIVTEIQDSEARSTIVTICHIMVSQAEVLAEKYQAPRRETYAAIARAASQIVIRILVESDNEAIRRNAKTNLIYFSTIEMLATGVKTGAYQFGFVLPEGANMNSFPRQEVISPIVSLSPGEDENRFKADLVLGGRQIDGHVEPLPGMEFFYLPNTDGG